MSVWLPQMHLWPGNHDNQNLRHHVPDAAAFHSCPSLEKRRCAQVWLSSRPVGKPLCPMSFLTWGSRAVPEGGILFSARARPLVKHRAKVRDSTDSLLVAGSGLGPLI